MPWQQGLIRACVVQSALQTDIRRSPPQAGAFRDAATAAPFKVRLSGADQLDEEGSRSFCARLSGLGVAFAKSSLSMMSCLPVVWSRPHVAAFFAMPPCCCMAWGMAGDSRMDTSCSMVRRRVAANSDRGAYFERCWLAENSTTHHDRGSIV